MLAEYEQSPLLNYALGPGVRAFSTTRVSPFSPSEKDLAKMGAYAAFNVTHYCKDDSERVARNRKWLCDTLGIARNALIIPRQVHGAEVFCVGQDFLHATELEKKELLEGKDALVTNLKNVCIGVSTADCIPILMYDPKHSVVAAVHAGWRGTLQRIALMALKVMGERFHTMPEDVHAVLGPGISSAAFEVGEEVVEAFADAGFNLSNLVSRRPPLSRNSEKQKPHIDLWAANAGVLEDAGVPLRQIQVCGICSYTNVDTFFSARRLGIFSGRTFSGILLRG